LSFSLERMREWLGPDTPSCAACSAERRTSCGGSSPATLADPAVRSSEEVSDRRAC
jgi:hypothetical protein